MPALDATLDIRCFPLGYAFHEQLQPDPLVFCDLPQCRAEDDSQPNVQRLNCGHSFHKCCMFDINRCFGDHHYAITDDVFCPVCHEPLREKMSALALTMNR